MQARSIILRRSSCPSAPCSDSVIGLQHMLFNAFTASTVDGTAVNARASPRVGAWVPAGFPCTIAPCVGFPGNTASRFNQFCNPRRIPVQVWSMPATGCFTRPWTLAFALFFIASRPWTLALFFIPSHPWALASHAPLCPASLTRAPSDGRQWWPRHSLCVFQLRGNGLESKSCLWESKITDFPLLFPPPSRALRAMMCAVATDSLSPGACVGDLLTTVGACVIRRVTQSGDVAEPLGP